MNIKTATIYAKHGYLIRRTAWAIGKTINVCQEIDDTSSYVDQDDYYAILDPEDCLADDWKLINV